MPKTCAMRWWLLLGFLSGLHLIPRAAAGDADTCSGGRGLGCPSSRDDEGPVGSPCGVSDSTLADGFCCCWPTGVLVRGTRQLQGSGADNAGSGATARRAAPGGEQPAIWCSSDGDCETLTSCAGQLGSSRGCQCEPTCIYDGSCCAECRLSCEAAAQRHPVVKPHVQQVEPRTARGLTGFLQSEQADEQPDEVTIVPHKYLRETPFHGTEVNIGEYKIFERGDDVYSQHFEQCVPVLVVNRNSYCGILCHLEQDQYQYEYPHDDLIVNKAEDKAVFAEMLDRLVEKCGKEGPYDVWVWDGTKKVRNTMGWDAGLDTIVDEVRDRGSNFVLHDESGKGNFFSVMYESGRKMMNLYPQTMSPEYQAAPSKT